jgi:hypothetical protein
MCGGGQHFDSNFISTTNISSNFLFIYLFLNSHIPVTVKKHSQQNQNITTLSKSTTQSEGSIINYLI